jgi:hypothetical protein
VRNDGGVDLGCGSTNGEKEIKLRYFGKREFGDGFGEGK